MPVVGAEDTFVNHQAMLDIAIQEARLGLAEGGIPIGAALFHKDGTLLWLQHSRPVGTAADLSDSSAS
jgi:cytosine/creatinine deaminase